MGIFQHPFLLAGELEMHGGTALFYQLALQQEEVIGGMKSGQTIRVREVWWDDR